MRHKLKLIILIVAFTVSLPSAAFAQSNIYKNLQWPFYDPSGSDFAGCGVNYTGGVGGGNNTQQPSDSQVQIAKIIMGVAKTYDLGKRGGLIGVMTGITESGLQIYANKKVPVSLLNPATQAVGSDGFSVGVFQQQPQYSWSTFATGTAALSNQSAVWQLMDPAYSAQAFFGTPPGAQLPAGLAVPGALTKGLQNLSGWQTLQPWIAAQKVQGSATSDGSNYRKSIAQAQILMNKYWDSAEPVPLPIPINGGVSSGGGEAVTDCDNSNAYGICEVTAPVYGLQNGSGNQYSQDQLTQIFGNPGTEDSRAEMAANLITIDFLGNAVSVHKKVAACLSAVANEIKQSGSNYEITSIGCYRYDSDNGSSNIGLRSYHTYGAACDINPETNPFEICPCSISYGIPKQYVQAFYNHGFTWGGYWSSRKDYMHFEFNGIKP